MGKSLEDYEERRDFSRTPEPPPSSRERRPDRPVFVVHRHEARRLHYDLRLEMDGALSSWAVPKGFSYDPADKHLAVRTEDHPIEYEDFHGVIPRGQYGAGTMTIWDRGWWDIVKADEGKEAVAAGELKFVLHGRKLHGEWHLVRTRGEEDHWLLFKSKDRYAGSVSNSSLVLDLSRAADAAFPRTWRRMECGAEAAAFEDPSWLFEMEFEGRRLFAFKRGDEVGLRGVRSKPPEIGAALSGLRAENALLDGVLVALDENERPSGAALEARLARESDAPLYYYAFDLLYFEDYDLRGLPLLERKGALRIAIPAGGHVLYVDHVVGSGRALAAAVAAAGLPGAIAKRATSAYHAGSSDDWRRIPAGGARDSDDAGDGAPEARAEPVAAARARAGARGARASRVRFTNLDKVFWPAEGYTKGDLVAHYEAVAEFLLPHLHDRPVHMNRFPDGIAGKSFYQKQANTVVPDWFERIPIHSGTHGEEIPYFLCNDIDTLLALANLGSIDLHPWLSRKGSLDSPDYTVLDLDPKGAPFGDVVRVAREVGKLLRGIGLRPLLKTSGKTGLHVFVPLLEGYDYEQSRMFSESVARIVARRLPEISTVERHVPNREGKVYIDYLQNRRGQTVVPPYSVRPVPNAPVSAPLHWDELDSSLSPTMHTIRTLPARLAQHGDLFQKALTDRQDLAPAIEVLAEQVARE